MSQDNTAGMLTVEEAVAKDDLTPWVRSGHVRPSVIKRVKCHLEVQKINKNPPRSMHIIPKNFLS